MIVTDGVDGFTFLTAEELTRKTASLMMAAFGTPTFADLGEAARRSVGRYGKQGFIDNVRSAILPG
jgi:hypothetical protein